MAEAMHHCGGKAVAFGIFHAQLVAKVGILLYVCIIKTSNRKDSSR